LIRHPVDFAALIADLKAGGMTARDMARKVGVHEATIWYWREGVEPKYEAGAALVELWVTKTGGDAMMLPRR
jgi:transposase-like protein